MHRLLPRHHRLLVWWALADLGIALPWLLAGDGDLGSWLRGTTTGPELACSLHSVTDGDTERAATESRSRSACTASTRRS